MKRKLMILDRSKETNDRLKLFLKKEFTVFQAFCEEDALVILSRMGNRIEAVLMEEAYWTGDDPSLSLLRNQILKREIPGLSLMNRFDEHLAVKSIENGAEEILI